VKAAKPTRGQRAAFEDQKNPLQTEIQMTTRCLLPCLMLATLAGAAEPLNVANRRQLLFDDRFVQQARAVRFVMHPPRKTGDIIVASEPGQPLSGYHSALFDAGVYHLWYSSGGCVLYARSRDGVHFEKPELNLRADSSPAGRPLPANAVMGWGLGDVKAGMHGLYVFIDPNAPSPERFKLVANPKEFNSLLQVFASPDGIHWKLRHRDVIVYDTAVKPHHLDSQNVIFWDDRLRKYVAYFRRNLKDATAQGRTVARAESPDFEHFPRVEDSPIVLRLDDLYRGNFDLMGTNSRAVIDVYASSAIKYPWAQDAYFMFPWQYYHYDRHQAEFAGGAPINAGVVDARFAASRDGIRWTRVDHRPWVRLGMQGDFDSKRIYLVHGIVPGANERELFMYYLGTSDTHGWGRPDSDNDALLTAAGLAPTGPNAISRLVLRRDGFVSVRAPYTGGEFTTPPLRFDGEQLLLNVDTSSAGELRVEIQDAAGKPIPGFALDDCDLIHTANEINRPVKWKGRTDIRRLAAHPIRLHFVMRDVDLYAFQFAERGGI
jgi:hypothetical protein